MKRPAAILTLAIALGALACDDESASVAPTPVAPRYEEFGANRVGAEKAPAGDFSAASVSMTVADIFGSGGSVTPTTLAQSLAGPGVTVQNVSFVGDAHAAGDFASGVESIGFDDGVILTSGWVQDVLGPNSLPSTTRALGTPGDAQLSALAGFPTYDATILSFEVVPDADKVYFEYVFGSEEYNEYVTSQYNDVFAFHINGQNCAVVGTPPRPVTINTINNGYNNNGVNPQNVDKFRNNWPATLYIEPDGLTTVLTCEASVVPNVPNTVRLAIADASDRNLDSWVFIKAGSFSTTPPSNIAPTLAPIADRTVDEGALATFTAVGADENVGQVLSYSLAGAPAGATIDPATGEFAWTPSDDDPTATPADEYSFTVRVTDDGSPALSAERTARITVRNVAPDLAPFTTYPAGPVALGSSITLTAPFGDPGSGDTFLGSIDWGDGSSSAATIAPFVSMSGSHAYAATGVYTVAFALADDDGGSDAAAFQYVVVYDPNAGFVTGGGSIDAPVGSYTVEPTLGGRATFGFVSKYRKGTTVPDGQTQFEFHAAKMQFHSVAYDWLVVSGAKAQFKGTGTIDGGGDYGFMLTVTDGQVTGGGGVDRFRMKIWDRVTGVVVFDNQLGDADDAQASTVLSGGSIVIHSK